MLLVALLATADAAPALAQTSSPAPPEGLTMTAEPMLGGSYRAGSWMAVLVRLQNDGPQIVGELRLSSTATAPSFSVAVALPTGSRQEHVIYAQVALGRYRVELLDGPTTIHSVTVTIETRAAQGLRTYILAERPELLVGGLTDALTLAGRGAPTVVSLTPAALPERALAWSSMDLLVWQDADSQALQGHRLEALRTWLAMGGHLLIVGGSTGVTTLGGFPADLLPYRPQTLVDVPAADLSAFAELPVTAGATSALAGRLERGSVLANSGDAVIAARAPFGRGSVTILGFDPGIPWIAESAVGPAVWARTLPAGAGPAAPLARSGDSFIVNALGNMPAVRLPQLFHLFVLLVAYVVAIGPINYAILRRRDRRELAWLTIPLTIAAFAVLAYVFGTSLRGPSVVINELAIVRGSTGADRGAGRVYIGVFSPGRASYDIQIGGNALVSAPFYEGGFMDSPARTLDILQGDPSIVRRFGVAFGSLRSFVAETSVATPLLQTELQVVGEVLSGTVTNSTTEPLSGVAVVYGGAVQYIGDMAAGETRSVDLAARGAPRSLTARLVPSSGSTDPEALRSQAARRAIVDHLQGGWNRDPDDTSSQFSDVGPTILTFKSGGPLEVSVDGTAEVIGETLYLLQARASVSGPVSLTESLLQRSVVASDAVEIFEEFGSFHFDRGTLSVEYRPAALEGTFQPTGLTFRIGSSSVAPGTIGEELPPLPADDQPDPDAPLAVNPGPDELEANFPRLQLFDVTTGTWVEFAAIGQHQTYQVADPARWLDQTATLRVRFVVRGTLMEPFAFEPRIMGTVE